MAKTGPKPKQTTCHPERKHHAKGLCFPCYDAQRRENLPKDSPTRRATINWYYNNKGQAALINRRSKLKNGYGLTIEQYDQMKEEQGGVCAICFQPQTRGNQHGPYGLAVDHDHTTKQVRGLLCNNCNNGLGRFKDNPYLLEQAAKYLRQWNSEGVKRELK